MSSSDIQTRRHLDALAADFNRTRAALIEAVESVPAGRRDQPFVGSWNLKDVVAHTIGWDYTNVEALPDNTAIEETS